MLKYLIFWAVMFILQPHLNFTSLFQHFALQFSMFLLILEQLIKQNRDIFDRINIYLCSLSIIFTFSILTTHWKLYFAGDIPDILFYLQLLIAGMGDGLRIFINYNRLSVKAYYNNSLALSEKK